MSTITQRVTALEVTVSGMLTDITDIQTALGVTPSSAQVAAALDPLRDDITLFGERIDAIDIAFLAVKNVVADTAVSIKNLQPSGSL